ncbi:bacteriocin biosynthesis cyclodehydratase domain-containing protein [Nocardioides salarius]|uniref:Bacteriocin biosynthesis cyclodehydratase domain-containing protein n=1 Tax=Nocardioides salarius TaxID=374513 RepID=A0ABS2ME81_9ACTN|nr:hypothetical protein [Nocardioides salarius]MBM7509498.1 bacteriocin biosynthesis cyclodehydratase domain-containing protein [Nocardioides salarius]
MSLPPVLPSVLPARPRLLPGVGVYRRDDRHLQVGLAAPRRVVLEDHPEVRTLLRSLEAPGPGAAPPPCPRRASALALLAAAGLLVDADELAAGLREAREGGGPDAAGVAASFCEAPVDAPRRLRERARARVQVLGEPGTCAEVVAVLRESGVGVCSPGGGPPTLALLVGSEPDRELVDDLVREQVAHLLVTAHLETYVVGPFVVPGRTACLRCLDAHAGDRDPRRAVVLAQHAQRARAPAAAPEPSDPVLRRLAVAWAVRDVVRHLDGQRPSTWSATTALGPDLVPVRSALLRHPHCGCAWDELSSA